MKPDRSPDMRNLLVLLTLGAGLALIGRRPRSSGPALLPASDDRQEPESWLAAEAEAYAAGR